MTLTPGFTTAVELFHKLQRDIKRVDGEVTSDRFFDLVVTGYSLIDWVRHDESLPAAARSQEEIFGLHNNSWLKVCGDLATASKHLKLTRRVPVVTGATTKSGFGLGRYGVGQFGIGEEVIQVEIGEGNVWDAREFAVGVLQAWLDFFARHQVPI